MFLIVSRVDLDGSRRGIIRLEVGLGVRELFGVVEDAQKNLTFLVFM